MGFSVLSWAFSSVCLLGLTVLTFAGLQWLNLPAGRLIDWVIGGASFLWLVLIVTVPWNIHFQAKAVLAEAEMPGERDTPIDPQQLGYVQKLARRSQWVAIVLHLISTVGLYTLSFTGISPIGYISSGAALLLTGLRPAIAAYQYFAMRLMRIGEEWRYPREDVWELRSRISELEISLKQVEFLLDPEEDGSWVARHERSTEELRRDLSRVAVALEDLRTSNGSEHERLSREAKNAISQLSVDSQFLDHVREIIRFFKTA